MQVFNEIDTHHHEFDLAMELLCSLPPEPNGAHFSTLARQLGIYSQEKAMVLVDRLRAMAFKIYLLNSDNGGRVLCVGKESWEDVKKSAQGYWDRLYGAVVVTEEVGRGRRMILEL